MNHLSNKYKLKVCYGRYCFLVHTRWTRKTSTNNILLNTIFPKHMRSAVTQNDCGYVHR